MTDETLDKLISYLGEYLATQPDLADEPVKSVNVVFDNRREFQVTLEDGRMVPYRLHRHATSF